jgi:signal transduction histidine kinase
MTENVTRRLGQLLRSLQLPAPEKAQRLARIQVVERNIVLPLKLFAVGVILFSLQKSPWFGLPLGTFEITLTTINSLFAAYIGINVLGATVLLLAGRLPFSLVRWSVFTLSLIDGVFIGALSLVSGGYDSPLFWLFVAMIVRNAASTPPLWSQLTLNLCVSSCFAVAGFLAIGVDQQLREEMLSRPAPELRRATNPAPAAPPAYALDEPYRIDPTEGGDVEAVLIRWLTLALTAVWLYAVQVLMEKQRLAAEESREFSAREGQLRSAGRLAAEFAHQIKNPLAIINNAVYSLERNLKTGKGNAGSSLQIIAEEVERADRIITQVMGYAELTEGRVERLDLTAEIEGAVKAVFPDGLLPGLQVRLNLRGPFPPMLMQRRHLLEIFVNLLQNAREALGTHGRITIAGHVRPDLAVEVTVTDDGPGISPDRLPRIFEAYYTTKARGTGLGLAIVKNNVELYGGEVKAESELGKGVRFTLLFPAKAAAHPGP